MGRESSWESRGDEKGARDLDVEDWSDVANFREEAGSDGGGAMDDMRRDEEEGTYSVGPCGVVNEGQVVVNIPIVVRRRCTSVPEGGAVRRATNAIGTAPRLRKRPADTRPVAAKADTCITTVA